MGGLQIATWGFSCQLFRQTSCKDRKGRGRGPAIARLWKGVRLCPSHFWDALALTWAVSSAVPMVLLICPAVSQSQGKTECW